MDDKDKKIRDLLSVAAVLVIILNISGLITPTVMYGILIVLWAVLIIWQTGKYHSAGRDGMAIALVAAGAAMIGLLLYRMRH